MTRLAQDSTGHRIQSIRPGVTQTVTVGGTSAATANGMGESTTIVRVVSTAACYFAVGKDPTATADDVYLPADVIEFVSVEAGDKFAFLQVSAGGTAFVTEGA